MTILDKEDRLGKTLIDQPVWYVILTNAGKEHTHHYPIIIYTDKDRAELVARANGDFVVPVSPVGPVVKP